jgi:hypothetical protein
MMKKNKMIQYIPNINMIQPMMPMQGMGQGRQSQHQPMQPIVKQG